MALTEAQKYLAEACATADNEIKVAVEVKGKVQPFTIRPLTSKEYNDAVQKTVSIASGGVEVKEDDGNEFICLQCVVEPDFKDQEWIDFVNANIKKHNAEAKKKVEEQYLKDIEKYNQEKETDENAVMPKKKKIVLKKEVVTSKDLLRSILMPGQIAELADKITRISGFGNKIQDYVEDVKKN